MTTFLYLDKSIPNESGANSKVIRSGAAWMPDNLEMALIKEYSKYVKLTATDPTVCKNLSEKLFIGDIPFLIPSDRTISIFLTNGIGDGSYVEEGSIIYTDTAKENLLSFIVEIVQKNIIYLLNDPKAHNYYLYRIGGLQFGRYSRIIFLSINHIVFSLITLKSYYTVTYNLF